jgi:PASTA domain
VGSIDEGSPIMAVDDPRDDEPEAGPPDAAADGTPRSTAPLDETREQPRGDTVEQPPADPWAEDTEARPAGSAPPSFPDTLGEPEAPEPGAGPVDVGPTGTGVLPAVTGDQPQPRWSARAQVRSPDVDDHGVAEGEWTEPGRSPLVPILVAVVILLFIGLVVLGAFLLLNNRDDAVTPPSTTPTVQTASAPATSPATRTTTTSAPPTTARPNEVEIPDLRGQDYDAAAAKLKDLGFVPRRVDEFNAQFPAGKVTGTNPPAGNKVRPGATIDVIVSKGLPQTTTPPKPTGSATPKPT